MVTDAIFLMQKWYLSPFLIFAALLYFIFIML